MIMITPAEFEDEMKKIAASGDKETQHRTADALMCAVLRDNGYETGAKVFEEMEKWYA